MKEAYYLQSFQPTVQFPDSKSETFNFFFLFNAFPTAFNPLDHFANIFFRIHMVLFIFSLAEGIKKEYSIWILKNQHHVLTSLFTGCINLDKLSIFSENSFLKLKMKDKMPITKGCLLKNSMNRRKCLVSYKHKR